MASYRLDSDSDEDVTEESIDVQNANKNTTWHLQDIEKLKEQTTELLDSSWKESRNKHLISKMLELEQPSITVKMVDFLLQDGVCESLMGFITQSTSPTPRPAPSDTHSPELKKAYRAVLLLSPEHPSDALNAFLSKKASVIARRIFDIFRSDSAGSFYHAYRILECLLRCYPSEVFDGLCSDGLLGERLADLLRYTGYAPVCEMLVMLVALTPIPRTNALFALCAKSRWAFLEELGNLDLMLLICGVIAAPVEHCECGAYVTAGQHSSAATQLFLELVEKLSLEEPGEVLLHSIGQFPTIMDLLVDTSIKPTEEVTDELRRCAARVICFLLRRAADAEILCYTVQPNGAPPTTTCVPNRLFALRESIVNHTRYRLNDIVNFLLGFDGGAVLHGTKEPIQYSSYEVAVPFTTLRSLVIEVLVLLVESEESVAGVLPVELWKLMIMWAIKYAHNNVYHALFYRIVFAVLRQGQEASQRLLFQKAKFASFLVENFVSYDTVVPTNPNKKSGSAAGSSAAPDKKAGDSNNSDLVARRVAARGVIMNCANAIRLQVTCQPPQSFLPIFLNAHPKWNDFVPQLMAATEIQLQFGMGIKVTSNDRSNSPMGGPGSATGSLGMLLQRESEFGGEALESSPEQASRFARSLGFIEEGEWSLSAQHQPQSSAGTTNPGPAGANFEHIPGDHGGGEGNEQHLVRRHSFEEGYGVFSHDYMEEGVADIPLVDEIDLMDIVRHAHSPSQSPHNSIGRLSSGGSPAAAAAVAAALMAAGGSSPGSSPSTSGKQQQPSQPPSQGEGEGGDGSGGKGSADEFLSSLPPPPQRQSSAVDADAAGTDAESASASASASATTSSPGMTSCADDSQLGADSSSSDSAPQPPIPVAASDVGSS